MTEIEASLLNATVKMYHGSPVWFIDDNPVVGYWNPKNGIKLLFWSGQSFNNPGLKPIGKHKAAGITYHVLEEINLQQVRDWLSEAKHMQWDYKNLRHNGGRLVRVE
jgi:hypothetical protein